MKFSEILFSGINLVSNIFYNVYTFFNTLIFYYIYPQLCSLNISIKVNKSITVFRFIEKNGKRILETQVFKTIPVFKTVSCSLFIHTCVKGNIT